MSWLVTSVANVATRVVGVVIAVPTSSSSATTTTPSSPSTTTTTRSTVLLLLLLPTTTTTASRWRLGAWLLRSHRDLIALRQRNLQIAAQVRVAQEARRQFPTQVRRHRSRLEHHADLAHKGGATARVAAPLARRGIFVARGGVRNAHRLAFFGQPNGVGAAVLAARVPVARKNKPPRGLAQTDLSTSTTLLLAKRTAKDFHVASGRAARQSARRMLAGKAAKVPTVGRTPVFDRWFRKAFGTHVVAVPFVALAAEYLNDLKIANWTFHGRSTVVVLLLGTTRTPRQTPAGATRVAVDELAPWGVVVVPPCVVPTVLPQRHAIPAGAALAEIRLDDPTGVVVRAEARKVARHGLVEFVRFLQDRFETLAHFGEQHGHDLVLCFVPRRHLVAFGLRFAPQIGFVELVAHGIVGFHEGNPQFGRMELHVGVFAGVLAFLDGGNVLRNRGVRANPVAVHERDELHLRDGLGWCGTPFFQQERGGPDATTDLQRWQFALARRPSFPRMVDFQPVLFQHHEPLGGEFFRVQTHRQLRLAANRVARTARQIVLDHQRVDAPLRRVPNGTRIHGFGGCDGWMRLIVVLSRPRVLKIVVGQQAAGVRPKLAATTTQAGKLLNQRSVLEFRSKLFRFRARVANVALLVQFFGGRHERFAANPQVAGGPLLQLDRRQRDGPPLVLGAALQLRHDGLPGLQTGFVQILRDSLVVEASPFPLKIDGSSGVVVGCFVVVVLHCCSRAHRHLVNLHGLRILLLRLRIIHAQAQINVPKILRHKGFDPRPPFHHESQRGKLTRPVTDHALFGKAVKLLLQPQRLKARESRSHAQIEFHARLHGADEMLVEAAQRAQGALDLSRQDGGKAGPIHSQAGMARPTDGSYFVANGFALAVAVQPQNDGVALAGQLLEHAFQRFHVRFVKGLNGSVKELNGIAFGPTEFGRKVGGGEVAADRGGDHGVRCDCACVM